MENITFFVGNKEADNPTAFEYLVKPWILIFGLALLWGYYIWIFYLEYRLRKLSVHKKRLNEDDSVLKEIFTYFEDGTLINVVVLIQIPAY